MNQCTERIALYGQADQCRLEAGHEGQHETTVWGPTIAWTEAA